MPLRARRASRNAMIVPIARARNILRRSVARYRARATRTIERTISAITIRSKTLTTVLAVSSFDACISWIGPEVGREGDPEGGLELGRQGLRRFRRGQVRQRHLGRDDPHRLEFGEGGPDDREDVDVEVAVDEGHVLGLAAQQGDDALMRERDGREQGLLDARVRQGDLEPLLDGLAHGVGDGGREHLRSIRQHRGDARLDVEGVDHLGADPGGEGIDDGRIADDVRHEGGESVRLQGHLMGPHGHRRQHDRDAREEQGDERQAASAAARTRAVRVPRLHRLEGGRDGGFGGRFGRDGRYGGDGVGGVSHLGWTASRGLRAMSRTSIASARGRSEADQPRPDRSRSSIRPSWL